MARPAPGLTLGPTLFHWDAERWRDFYFRIADEADIETVYLGEVVCAKRRPFILPHLAKVHERLKKADKDVVLSTLALIMTADELDEIRQTIADPDLIFEANDISTASLLAERRHVIGPFVNAYNEGTINYLAKRGAYRVSLPAELSLDMLEALGQTDAVKDISLEVQVFGRLPLAISARCYHARAHDLHKDGCQFVCGNDPDGLTIETLDDEPFLAINGTQTMSDTYCSLLAELPALMAAGIDKFRLWPHSCDMVQVAVLFKDVLNDTIAVEEAEARLDEIVGDVPLANGYLHGREGRLWVEAAAE
ncbi:MAG: U32 family peptidase [Rhodospirillaceae bacterium]|nr:U32 family peptidase [Rhodospirillaceae bacterium]MBT3492445.1 U32 family peptidase [Rhodospirillaceae bacterium]MBT3782923.1 U32 family peptidase [Rhodospirillaceae bacterium]MBT3977848.1 U32 family peptidase [Rhodospirillaceae bacterium]MBT4171469.1 U32 family peptidase [Rhodospirillaceae bacterium]